MEYLYVFITKSITIELTEVEIMLAIFCLSGFHYSNKSLKERNFKKKVYFAHFSPWVICLALWWHSPSRRGAWQSPFISWLRSKERYRKGKGLGSRHPLWRHVPNDLKAPVRAHLLRFPSLANRVIDPRSKL
jgi:hypothetical protein